jgi:AraC-like DNA-binding protein
MTGSNAAMHADFDSHSVSSSYVRLLAEMVASRGVEPRALLASTGIHEQLLDRADERVPAAAMLAVIENALRLTGDQSLGLQFGIQLKLSTHGFVGFAVMSCDTLGDALELGVKYFRTRFGLLDVRYFREAGEAVIEVEPVLPLGRAEAFVMDALVAAFATMGVNLLGELPATGSSRLRMEKPAYHDLLMQHIPERRITYGASSNQIRVPLDLLSRPLAFSDAASRRLAEDQCKKELALLQESESIIARVRNILLASGQRFPKLEVVAGQCYMSARTFKRRLQQVGTSFQEILDDIRRSRAIEYLRYTTKPIDEIAVLLGYNDPSNFGRAFKRWTGKTPSQYRHQHDMMPALE